MALKGLKVNEYITGLCANIVTMPKKIPNQSPKQRANVPVLVKHRVLGYLPKIPRQIQTHNTFNRELSQSAFCLFLFVGNTPFLSHKRTHK